jgi:hypothetical protein
MNIANKTVLCRALVDEALGRGSVSMRERRGSSASQGHFGPAGIVADDLVGVVRKPTEKSKSIGLRSAPARGMVSDNTFARFPRTRLCQGRSCSGVQALKDCCLPFLRF